MNKKLFYAIALICAIAFTGCKDKNSADVSTFLSK